MNASLQLFFGLLLSQIALLLVSAPLFAQENAAPAATEPATAQKTYALGVAVPLSGEFAPLGKQVLEAARVAAAEAGGRIVSQDTEGTPTGAIKAIQALAADPTVLAVLGPVGRRESQAAAHIAQRLGLPLFTLAGDANINRAGAWIFRLHQTPAEQAQALAKAARDHLGEAGRAAIFFPESAYGSEAAVAFAVEFTARGGRISAVASYPADTTDFRKPLAELVGTRARIGPRALAGKQRADRDGYLKIRPRPQVDFDLLFIPDFHPKISRMLAFFAAAGLQTGEGKDGVSVQMLGLAGWQGSSMRLSGALAAGAIYSDIFAGEADGGPAQDFALLFEGTTGRRPVDLDAEVFDAAWMLGKIIAEISPEKAQGAEKMRLHLANQLPRADRPTELGDVFHGVCGALGFGDDGRPLRPIRLYQFDIGGSVAPWH